MSEPAKVAVIDIGSNSIKLLVARRGTNCGRVKPVHEAALTARISAGINRAEPRLSDEGMRVGLRAIEALLAEVAPHQPRAIQLVATSAVRDALNRNEFINHVRQSTGHTVRTLTGTEEANFIGRGLRADPTLADAEDYYVFDLGGGSLECLRFQQRAITTAISLPLGCVRLTERFITATETGLDETTVRAIERHVQEALKAAAFRFDLPPVAPVVGTGGSVVACRAVIAAQRLETVEASPSELSLRALRTLRNQVVALPLATRRQIPGLP
ncbi:MAG: Ppx/GppA phosphatase family protein, partial [Cephaloticoccus sp.]